MIALRLLLGKTSTSSSCTYEPKSYAAEQDHSPIVTEQEYKLQKALDENTLQRLLIDQLQTQLAAQSAYIQQQQQENTVLHTRVSNLEQRLSESESQLAESVATHAQAKAHIAALQHQRSQLVLELEQMEDGFQLELHKVSGELKSWERDMISMDERKSNKTTSRTPSQTHTRTPSTASSTSRTAILTASLERAKSATRIWALEDEVDRVRHERDALRKRLNTGRANLMQLKRQASEVAQGRLGRAGRVNKSESNLKNQDHHSSGRIGGGGGGGSRVQTRASDMQLNTRVRPAMRGEPLTPETSDDNRSIEMNM
ncbi:hypothetical protein FRC07_008604 [Ceratobasidium sp. 392]|nr:hypothetical protein FRC07_008604 [Ceratobasidium sp. 392]